MRKLYCAVIALMSIISLPIVYAGGLKVTSMPRLHKRTVKVAPFDVINAQGYFDVQLVNSPATRKPGVIVQGYPLEPIQVRVSHHTLYLKSPWHPIPGMNRREIVTVNVNQLKKLTIAGPTNVRGTKVHSNGLTIDANGTGSVLLRGKIKLNRIKQTGQNHIDLRWIDSSTLYVSSDGSGSIRLAGVADTLYARLKNNAALHAQYLRTHFVQVQTKNKSAAFVCPIETLRAFALGDSNVYYYKYPKNVTRYSSQSGNVLQMAWNN